MGHFGYQMWAYSGASYIFNNDVGASEDPLNEHFSQGPITRAQVSDYSAWQTIMLSTTMFDQP